MSWSGFHLCNSTGVLKPFGLKTATAFSGWLDPLSALLLLIKLCRTSGSPSSSRTTDTAIWTTNLPSSSTTSLSSFPFLKLWLMSLCIFLLFLLLSPCSWTVREGLRGEVADTEGKQRGSMRVQDVQRLVEWNWISSRNRPCEQGALSPSPTCLLLFFLTFLLLRLSRESRRRLSVARAPRKRRRTSKRWAERRRGKRVEQGQQEGDTGGRMEVVWGRETGEYKTEEETDVVGDEQGG